MPKSMPSVLHLVVQGLLPLAMVAVFVQARLASVDPVLGWLPLFFDDFYYYLEAARQFAEGNGSTFDGITQTNGYHPLWFLLIAGLCVLFDPQSHSFFVAMTVLIGACSLLQFYATVKLLEVLGEKDPLVRAGIGLITQMNLLGMGHWGLESSLVAPAVTFGLWAGVRLLQQPGPKTALVAGAMVAFIGLSRLDGLFLVPLLGLVALVLVPGQVRAALRPATIGAAVLGAAPLALYFLSNLIWFDGVTTVSSAAKTLAPIGWNDKPLGLLGPIHRADTALYGFAGLGVLSLVYRPLGPPAQRAVLAAGLLLPAALLVVFSFLSDWIIWRWYLYPMIVALPLTCLIFVRMIRLAAPKLPEVWTGGAVLGAGVALLLLSPMIHQRETAALKVLMRSIAGHAVEIAQFAATRPGIYAMGDRAGVVGFVLDQPVIQIEGLMSDRALIADIAAQRDLMEVLRERKVDYLITTVAHPDGTGCRQTFAPDFGQAGNRSPKMRGRLCGEPLMEFTLREGDWVTRIYPVPPAPIPAPPL